MMEENNKQINKKQGAKHAYLKLAVSCVFLGFTLFIFAPFEMYIGNITELWFSIDMFWYVPLIVGICVIGITFILGAIMRGIVRSVYTAAVFGIGLAVYVQGNFLNINTGRLNGASVVWMDYKANFIIDAIVWAICIFAPIVLTLIFKYKAGKPILAIAALLTLMQATTLGVLFATAKWDATPANDGYLSNKGLYEIGSQNNTVVLIMDMYDDRYFKELLVNEPQLADKFDGFTLFTNNTGAYCTTLYAIPSMITGEQMLNFAPFEDMVSSNFEKNDYWKKLKDNDYSYKIYSPEAHLPSWMYKNVDNFVEQSVSISDYKKFTKRLYRFVAYKYLPNAIKPYIWMDGTEFNKLKSNDGFTDTPYDMSNGAFKSGIETKGITVGQSKNSISFIHTHGAHYPYMLDANGNDQDVELTYLESARGALKLSMDYIDGIKNAGLLDNTTVILTADHGCTSPDDLVSPLMLIKPAGAAGKMKTSSAPVSSNDIVSTIMSCAGLNDNNEYGKSIFDYSEGEARERKYYTYTFADITDEKPFISTLFEFAIKPENNDMDSFYPTGYKYDKNGEKLKNEVE
ncbi:MAG: hypothetical protein RR654_02830 [Oscillospiraceae bacterium]